MNIREISDVFKDTANQITALKSYNFGWPSDRTRSSNTEDYQELNEFPRVFFSVPTITGSDQTRKQDTYQVTLFFDDLLGYNNEGDADLTLQLDKWAALQEYANYFIQRLNKVKQTILPNYLFIPEAPSITFDSFTGLQRMITVQLSFTLVVPTNCEPVVTKLVECIANIVTSSNLTASLTTVIKLVSSLQASSSLSASVLVSKLAQSNLNTESSLSANIQIAKLASLSLTGAGTLVADLTVTSGSAFDADAQAFFDRVTTAGGTLSATEQSAVNTLVIALKADGIWTKMKAIYPMVGASAAACAQNLVSASFTGTFSSGWTFSSTGVTGNGTSSFMDSNFIPTTNFASLNNKSFGVYIGTNTNNGIEMGSLISGFIGDQIVTRITNIASSFNSNNESTSIVSLDSRGFWLSSRQISASANYYKNALNVFTNGASNNQSAFTFKIGARSIDAFIQVPSDKRIQFAFMGDGLDATQVTNFYTAVQAFQTSLSRQV